MYKIIKSCTCTYTCTWLKEYPYIESIMCRSINNDIVFHKTLLKDSNSVYVGTNTNRSI